MKKLLFLAVIIYGIIGIKNVDAAMLMERRTMFGYDAGDTHYSLKFYEDLETNKPVFRLRYDTEFEEPFDIEDTEQLNLTEEELKLIKDIIFYITEEKSYNDCTMNELIGTQALIWEIYSKKTDTPIKWSCDVGFLVDYRKMIEEKRKEYETPVVHNYLATVNNPLKIDFLAMFKEPYQIKSKEEFISVSKEENSFIVTSTNPGNYKLDIISDYFDEKVKLFASENNELIELVKMGKTKPVINIEVAKEAPVHYGVQLISDEGINISLKKDLFLSGESVKISYKLQDKYELSKIEAFTQSGKKLEIKNNEFIMPEENVVIHAMTLKKEEIKPQFQIKNEQKDGISIYIEEKEYAKEQVIFHYELEKNYELEYFLVKTSSGKEIKVENCTFVMPEEDITIIPMLKKKEVVEEKPPVNVEVPKHPEKEEEIYQIPNTKKDIYVGNVSLILFYLCSILYAKKCKKV